MQILMFPQQAFPCTHAMLESVYARILPARGHTVHWVMRAADHSNRHPERPWHGSTVTTVPLRIGGAVQNARTSISEAAWTRRFLDRRSSAYDIVQVRNEVGPSLAALRTRRRAGFSFVYQLSWLSAEVRLMEAARGTMRPAWYHLARGRAELRARDRIVRGADAVLAISDAMRSDLITASPGLEPARVVSFPLGFDATVTPAIVRPADARKDLGLPDRPTAVYFGTMSSLRRLHFLIEVIVCARRTVPDLALVMVGGEGHAALAEAFDRAAVHDVHFTGRLSRADTAKFVCAADVSIVPIPPIPELLSSSPTKLIESLGLGVPVVANLELPENDAVIRASGGGLLVPYDPEAFAAAAVQIVSEPGLRARLSTAGREWVHTHRDYEVLATRVEEVYRRIRNVPPGAGA